MVPGDDRISQSTCLRFRQWRVLSIACPTKGHRGDANSTSRAVLVDSSAHHSTDWRIMSKSKRKERLALIIAAAEDLALVRAANAATTVHLRFLHALVPVADRLLRFPIAA